LRYLQLRTYAIAIPQRKDGPLDGEFADEALRRARDREDNLVPEYELANLVARVPECPSSDILRQIAVRSKGVSGASVE
jgi:hypothetical protein